MAITRTAEIILKEQKRIINDEIKALRREIDSLDAVIVASQAKKADIQAKIRLLDNKVTDINSDIVSVLIT